MFIGDVYIHVLATGRNPVEDPPSISEGCGGRVTDYRIEVRHIVLLFAGCLRLLQKITFSLHCILHYSTMVVHFNQRYLMKPYFKF